MNKTQPSPQAPQARSPQRPALLPTVEAACNRLIDTIAAETQDVHDATNQLNGSLHYINEHLKAAQHEAIAHLDAMLAESRRNRAAQKALARLAEPKTEAGPPKLEIAGIPE